MAFQNWFVILLLTASSLSTAAEQPETLASVLDQQRALQADLAADEVGFTPRERGVIRKAQGEIFKLTEGKTSLDQLNIEERVRLDMALERINTQVKGGDLDHVAKGEEDVCKRVRRTGATMKTTVCATQAEWDHIRQNSRDSLEKQRVCVPPGCGQ